MQKRIREDQDVTKSLTLNQETDRDVRVGAEKADVPVSRLRELLSSHNLAELARKSGIGESSLRQYKAGSIPGVDRAAAIARAAGVSLDWLVGSDHADAVSAMSPDLVAYDEQGRARYVFEVKRGNDPHAPHGEFVLLPRYEVRAGAGGGQVVHSDQVVDHLAFKRDWVLQRLRRDPGDLILIEASGDSMADKIRHGDLLLVDTAVERVHDHAIYALNIGGELMVKYVQRLVAGGCRIFSENPKYPPEDLTAQDLEQLRVVGQVIWAGGLL